MISKGTCYLVGGGPGDPGLLTLKAKSLLEEADVVVYDSLVNERILDWVQPSAEQVYAGKRANKHVMKQADINELLISRCREHKSVVRLKGGDPFIFGRGGEEAAALAGAGVPFEVIPGVTSGIAVPSYAGIPLTHREHSTSVTFVTGHECPKESGETDWAKLAALGGTLVIYMGVKNLPKIAATLIQHGMDPDTPAAFIQWGCDPRQQSLSATLSSLPSKVAEAGLAAPAIIVVGQVASLHDSLPWFSLKPLLGTKILVTRTRPQNSRLRQLLEEQGARVVEMPLIKIQKSKFEVPNLNKHSWLVFTSPNAVDFFLREITNSSDIRVLGPMKIAAVGPATADELLKWHVKADFIPSKFDALHLAAEWPEDGRGQKVLFPCGTQADHTLEEGLKKKGFEVTRLEIYGTSPDPRAGALWQEHRDAGWILFCSSSAAKSFRELEPGTLPLALKVASLGPRTSATLEGFKIPHVTAGESSLQNLVQTLVDHASSQ